MPRILAAGLAATVFALAFSAGAQEPAKAGIDPKADAVLRKMTDYVAGLDRFEVEGHGTVEAVLTSGQKLQFDQDVTMTVDRPDRMRATRKGAMGDQVLQYDGKRLSLYDPEEKVYAIEQAPPTLEGALDFSREQLDIVAPAADLAYADAYEQLTQDVTEGFVVDEHAWVDGQDTTQIAFRKPGVDVQIWVKNGDQPLPLKYVLTTTDQPGNPEFVLTLSKWNTKPKIVADTFAFEPPPGATEIEFLHLQQPAPAN